MASKGQNKRKPEGNLISTEQGFYKFCQPYCNKPARYLFKDTKTTILANVLTNMNIHYSQRKPSLKKILAIIYFTYLPQTLQPYYTKRELTLRKHVEKLANALSKSITHTPNLLQPIPDMDTSSGPSKRSLRADITRKYEQRVAETIEKVDPNRAKARNILKDVKDGEVTAFEGSFSSPAAVG